MPRLNPFRRQQPPPPDPGRVVLFAPALDRILLQDAAGRPAWAVMKPGTWRGMYGTSLVTLEKLQVMAASYDPEQLDAAPLNFDHQWGGPAHGWVEEAFVRDELLWVIPRQLSQEMADGIKAGRYQRASCEIDTDYEPTNDWYLEGLAILGNAKPAVKGLPKIALADDRYIIHLAAEPDPPAPADPTATPGQEPAAPAAEPEPTHEGDPTMSSTATQPQPGATGTQPGAQPTDSAAASTQPTQATATASPDPNHAALAASRAALDEEVRLARESRERTQAFEREARQERATARVDRDLAALGGRITPAERSTLRPVLLSLASAETPRTVQLAAPTAADPTATREASEYDALLASYQARPDYLALLGSEIAGQDGDAPGARNLAGTEERRIALAHGITEEQQLEIQRKYGHAFRDPVTGQPLN